jgi:hypothetical protein
MKRLISLLIFALCLPLTAHADDANKRAKVHEMLDLLHMDRMMAQIMDLAMQQATSMTNQMVGNNLTPDQKAKVEAFQKQVLDTVEAQVGWKAMEPQYIDLYVQTFSEEDLDGIIAFYKSPAGVSMISKTPELTQKSMAMVQQKMTTLQPQLQQMIQDFARSAAKPAAPSMKSN